MANMPQAIQIKMNVNNPKLPNCQADYGHDLDRVDNRTVHNQMIVLCRDCGIMVTYEVTDASGS